MTTAYELMVSLCNSNTNVVDARELLVECGWPREDVQDAINRMIEDGVTLRWTPANDPERPGTAGFIFFKT